MKESNNKDAEEVKKKIDEIRKQRLEMISEVKRYRKKAYYKEAEFNAISKFVESAKATMNNKKSGALKRMKNELEFNLSTRARVSLNEEREMVRKINEINAELEDYYKFIKLQKKIEYIKGDLEEYSKLISEKNKLIEETDVKLDELYRSLKRILGINERRERDRERMRQKSQAAPPQNEINLEDIAVIRKKESKNGASSPSE
ncbi:MAG: hypothetical protein M1559_02615 [Candidatus Marsarchaeota archaeon]|nr:hypothetical protein [Candidatus Marsarchaeota archaeon]MCL5434581.1 hypothetical protein [Candidatus Marsarchaeota archaeon]